MSKAGVIGHFGTKQALQLAALEDAIARFTESVWVPASRQPAGLPRLLAIVEAWSAYLTEDVFPGGCFLTAASFEFDGRTGPVRDRLAAALRRWGKTLAADVRAAVEAGDLPPDTDPEQVVFELTAIATGATQAAQLHGDPASAARCRAAMERVLCRSQP
jgi:AcrR family transcriptional regulator